MARLRPYAMLFLFSLPALWPLLHEGLPRTNDALPHLYRAIQLDALVRAGDLFPRWAPDLVFGYGYPVFNFFPYLAHSLIVGGHALGFDFLTAYKIASALALCASGWTAFALGRELFGERAGLVAGVAYLYSPYLLYDLHVRGSLPESLALAVMPLGLLFLRRAARGEWRAVAFGGLALAACLLSHQGIMVQALPFIGLYALFEWLRAERSARNLGWIAATFALGFALAAFFLLPALLESSAVQIERGTNNGGMDYRQNFLSWAELFAWPRLPVDPALLNPPLVRPLPHLAVVLALVALLLAWRERWPSRWHLAFFAGAAFIATLLIHPVAGPVWEAAPLLRLTLFPWRLLGPISLLCALGAGALFATQAVSKAAAIFFTLTLSALCILNLPFASPPLESVTAQPTLADMAAFELPPDFIGTTTVGEYLPRWVRQLPGDAGQRRDLAQRPRYNAPGATVEYEGERNSHTFTVTAIAPVSFIFNQFYFPGWRVARDGESIEPRITEPEGLMAVDLLPGTHTLTFTFGDTWPRQVGNWVSVMAVVVTGGLLVIGNWRPMPKSSAPQLPITNNQLLFLFPLAIVLALSRPLLYDAGLTPLLRFGLGEAGLATVRHPLNHNFDHEITLLGWESSMDSFGADEAVTLNLYLKANRRLGVPYGVEVKLVDVDGLVWSERDTPRPRDWRYTPGTDFWPVEEFIHDPYLITPLAGTPPGEYWFSVDVFSRYDLRSLGVVRLGPVKVATPSRRACEAAFTAPLQAAPGDDLLVSICIPSPHRAYDLRLTGDRPILYHSVPAQGRVGEAGFFIRDQFNLRLPADADSGAYQWTIETGDDVSAMASPLILTAPERAFTAPPVAATLDADLGAAALHGMTFPANMRPGETLTVTLVWRADELFEDSYSTFVHVQSADATIVAQSDGTPANGARRTTGWLPGEFVADARTIPLPADLPPGPYALFAGLYRPGDGVRLTSPDFPDGRVPLGTVTVGD